MMRVLACAAGLFSLAAWICLTSIAHAGEPIADIVGNWRITAVLDAAEVSGMSDREAKRMIGKPVHITATRFEFDGMICDSPTYERSVEDTVRHLREKGLASSANLGLPHRVTVIDAKCTFIYLKRKNMIVMGWDGVYFDAIRQGRQAPNGRRGSDNPR